MGANKDLGLPFDKMKKVAICFDVDGTLIDKDEMNYQTVELLDTIMNQRWKNLTVIIWSGGGADYARTIIRDIRPQYEDELKFYSKLQHKELRTKYHQLIAIDDIQDTSIGDINLIVRNK